MDEKPLVYLACPYSHDDPVIREMRFKQANMAAGKLMERGYIVFSPLSHCHPISVQYRLPTDWEFWQKFCTTYVRLCNTMFVLMVPGWEESRGITEELKLAKELGIHVEFIST